MADKKLAPTTTAATELNDEVLDKISGGHYPEYDPSGSCLTPDTKILLADGGAKRVDELADDDIAYTRKLRSCA